MSVVLFPPSRVHRPQPVELPPDAQPIGRESSVLILPETGGWAAMEMSDSGASYLVHSTTKETAIQAALAYVRRWNAELTLTNKPDGA
jgi:hypothetical protein